MEIEKQHTLVTEISHHYAPWLDIRLTKQAMDHLWDAINGKKTDVRENLAGNISKSDLIQDKDNLFFENELKAHAERLYYRNWDNYYNVHIMKCVPLPEFELSQLWVNYQKQHEFNPPHNHSGLFSFVVFMKIPTHWEEQHALPICVNSNIPSASNFAFLIGQKNETVVCKQFKLSSDDEGRMLIFPALLYHQVFPFYNCEEERITVSGNIFFKREEHKTNTFKGNEKW